KANPGLKPVALFLYRRPAGHRYILLSIELRILSWSFSMNVDEYERKYEPIYAELAETVRSVLAKAIHQLGDNSQPQAIQCRQKTPKELGS
ncbi:MAG: hypothetical protein ACP5OS_08645, partial [Leptospirillia bacterium]